MPSGTAMRPSDVITIRGGKTVEVLNTDAEGRLVMADGLVAAVEENPDVVLDIATLTGAQVVALGNRVSAVMGTDDVRAEVVAAAEAAGEQFWPMPLPEELLAGLKSKVADLANIGDRAGGMLTAGRVPARVRRLDAVGRTSTSPGPAFNDKSAHGYTPVGGTGVGVRTMLALLEARAGSAAAWPPQEVGLSRRRRTCRHGPVAADGGNRRGRWRLFQSRIRCGYPTRCTSYTGTPRSRATVCAVRSSGTRRRVHSPVVAMSMSVTGVSAVRGSTYASTPTRVRTKSVRCARVARWASRDDGAPSGRAGRRRRVRRESRPIAAG